jgi:hypothetical protein
MSDHDRFSTTVVRETTGGGGLYLIIGALVVAVLVGAYILMGTPGLHTQVAKAPADQVTDVAVGQPGTPAPPSPDSAGPAPGR